MDGTGPNFEPLPPHDGAVPAYLPAPSPAGPPARRGWIGPAIGAGAVILAAGAFLLGHATAGPSATPAAGAALAATPASADSAKLLGTLGLVDPAAAVAAPPAADCGPRGGAIGTLKSVSGSTLTVTNRKGQDVIVKTDANTNVIKVTSGAIGDVVNDAVVAVRGSASGTTIAADKVAIVPSGLAKPRMPPHRPGSPAAAHGGAIGTVQTVTGSGFTLKQTDGTIVTVTTSSTTTFTKATLVKVGDLTVGQPVAAAGSPNTDGSINATRVMQSPAGLPGFGGPGGFGRFGHGGGEPRPAPGSTPSTTTP